MKSKRCKNCRHYQEARPDRAASCGHSLVGIDPLEQEDPNLIRADALVMAEPEPFSCPSLHPGPEFGCVHWEG